VEDSHFNEYCVQLVIDEPVGVQDRRKIPDYFRGIHRIYPNLIKETHATGWNTRISTDYAQKSPRSLA
jgi:hypothetical protein